MRIFYNLIRHETTYNILNKRKKKRISNNVIKNLNEGKKRTNHDTNRCHKQS